MKNIVELYVLESTGDKRDRSTEIEAMLKENGVCILGSGVYYVSGVKMPDHSTLMGMGECSEVFLLPEVENGSAIFMGSRCCIKNIAVKGSEEDGIRPEEMGTRHGISFSGTATSEDWSGQIRNCIIESCQIRGFSGGGITCVDTGYSVGCSVTATNCHINFCGAGINISHFSEFHRFTNMYCCHNFYGCINNGGNNVFVNCVFDSNNTGYLIDNSDGMARNNSHGSVVGCTFNHSGRNKGIGIQILGAQHGYVFTACQVFYSKIVLKDTSGIQFNDFNFGKNSAISVDGGNPIFFSSCLFVNQPTVTLENGAVIKSNFCFLRTGEDVTFDF